jgi:hypothetical protein
MPFNQEIGIWNTSRVTTMRCMFYGAAAFNQEIFGNATSFNQEIESWDKSIVTGMSYIFVRANAFNQEIGKSWSISNVTSLSCIFRCSKAYVESDKH